VGVIALSESTQQASSDSWEGEVRLSIAHSSVPSIRSAARRSRGDSAARRFNTRCATPWCEPLDGSHFGEYQGCMRGVGQRLLRGRGHHLGAYADHSSGQYTPVCSVWSLGAAPSSRGSASQATRYFASFRAFCAWRFAAAAWLPRGAIALR
jgi:hypothetical protein